MSNIKKSPKMGFKPLSTVYQVNQVISYKKRSWKSRLKGAISGENFEQKFSLEEPGKLTGVTSPTLDKKQHLQIDDSMFDLVDKGFRRNRNATF